MARLLLLVLALLVTVPAHAQGAEELGPPPPAPAVASFPTTEPEPASAPPTTEPEVAAVAPGTEPAPAANASPFAPPPPAPPASPDRYLDYRPYLLGSDLLVVGTLITAGAMANGASGYVALGGLGIYALGAPIVHLAYGQPLRAAGSLGMRVGFPVAGAALGIGLVAATCDANSGDSEWGCLAAAVGLGGIGLIAGTLTAVAIDDAVLGKVKLAPERASRRVQVGVVPLIASRGKTLGASLVGAF